MAQFHHNRWLHRFAVFSAVATWILIGIGGLVTSHEAGMAVPDWPTTYGYNMFLFPPSYWVGGIFYEHSHRLFASFVGLLTTILAIWLWVKDDRQWLRWLGVVAFFSVVAQGVLGGIRVTLMIDELGIFHAAFAQLLLVLLSLVALATSRWWKCYPGSENLTQMPRGVCGALLLGTLLVFGQLILGATMRHQHAGLAVPDFPLAYGTIWPSTDEAFLDKINRERIDVLEPNPITAFQIHLHMIHRVGALITLGVIAWLVWMVRSSSGSPLMIRRIAVGWCGLMLLQAAFGVFTVLSNKAADVATAHVMVGAVSLVVGVLLYVISLRFCASICGALSVSKSRTEKMASMFEVNAP